MKPFKQQALSLAVAGTVLLAPAFAGPVADQFKRWHDEPVVTRRVALSDLGITTPLILSGDSQRDLYLPVPVSLPIRDAALQFNGSYLRGNGGRSLMLLSVDGEPVVSNRITDDRGDAAQRLAVNGDPRKSGFLRFGIGWSSVISDDECADQRAPGNVLRVLPDSTLSYSFDPRGIRDLATAWTALPLAPTLLVSQRALQVPAFDAAWRLGLALEQAGKRVQIKVLPAVGDQVDLRGLAVPESLRGIPAFAALAGGDPAHRIGSEAELGALLALGQNGPLGADVVIRDDVLVRRLQTAFDALGTQVQAAAPDAAGAYTAWRSTAWLGTAVLDGGGIRLATLGSGMVIAVDAAAGVQAANLFTSQWRSVALGKALTVQVASGPAQGESTILLNRFGTMAGTLDVLGRSDRSVSFDLGAVAGSKRQPVEFGFNIVAAPNVAGEAPVASVFLNDFLIGSARLNADGKPQWVRAAIPRHVLAARNEVKISFLRQPTRLRCHDQATSYPVSILPGSYVRLDKGTPSADFIGVAAGFGEKHDVIVPAAWLGDAPTRLRQLIRVAGAAGISVADARLQVVGAGKASSIAAPFLALDVPVGDAVTAVSSGRLVINGKQPLLDLSTLNHVAVAEVVKASGQLGIAYRTVGAQAPLLDRPFRLARGDVAVLGDDGVVLQVDSRAPAELEATKAGPTALWHDLPALWKGVIGGAALLLLVAMFRRLLRKKPKG
ncbi:cellulose biosynthesis cyclic di-GMP-binding regulatory protein BcsB [Jeongeupia sp. USM3]|uniref:cellulose biosynthesis cyclic di-GMP-binding regulatory protein BcsB n=1 Tax=Jeongeupia sp. USM3 TaxID=1906741 RepID=UPI00089DE701|nr:cellulose biosynthesis cyclic di-GMP-binding regulatory protein BcsB [Jeongeupia sp. USM3]AOY00815.1 hypothetical protein BJP62_10420 [Jeongeupia sp. USM3]